MKRRILCFLYSEPVSLRPSLFLRYLTIPAPRTPESDLRLLRYATGKVMSRPPCGTEGSEATLIKSAPSFRTNIYASASTLWRKASAQGNPRAGLLFVLASEPLPCRPNPCEQAQDTPYNVATLVMREEYEERGALVSVIVHLSIRLLRRRFKGGRQLIKQSTLPPNIQLPKLNSLKTQQNYL